MLFRLQLNKQVLEIMVILNLVMELVKLTLSRLWILV